MTFGTSFELGQRVKVKAHSVTGVINSFWMGRSKVMQYEVEYQSGDGKIAARYFTAEELTPLEM